MSSDALTKAWEAAEETAPMTWKEVERKKWEERAEGCPAKVIKIFCKMSDDGCRFETCFARYWGMV